MMASEAHLNLKYFLRQLNEKKNKEDESTREREREWESWKKTWQNGKKQIKNVQEKPMSNDFFFLGTVTHS